MQKRRILDHLHVIYILFITTSSILLLLSTSFVRGSNECRYNKIDLSPWRNVTLTALTSGGKYDLSLCGDLPIKCEDSLTHVNISGKVYSYFGNIANYYCWDVLVQSLIKPKYRNIDKGLEILYTRHGDAHLSCESINVHISIYCDLNTSSLPAKALVAGEQNGCTWDFKVNSSNTHICI